MKNTIKLAIGVAWITAGIVCKLHALIPAGCLFVGFYLGGRGKSNAKKDDPEE